MNSFDRKKNKYFFFKLFFSLYVLTRMARIISSKSKRRPYQKTKYDKKELDKKTIKTLLSIAKRNIGGGPIIGRHSLKKDDLVKALLTRQRGIRQVKTCPDRGYKCKRTGPLETPVLTDKGCRYCKLHPKRKVGQRKLDCSKRTPRPQKGPKSCKRTGWVSRVKPRMVDGKCSKCWKSGLT